MSSLLLYLRTGPVHVNLGTQYAIRNVSVSSVSSEYSSRGLGFLRILRRRRWNTHHHRNDEFRTISNVVILEMMLESAARKRHDGYIQRDQITCKGSQ